VYLPHISPYIPIPPHICPYLARQVSCKPCALGSVQPAAGTEACDVCEAGKLMQARVRARARVRVRVRVS
jgi:hypothetical protein